MPNRGGSRGKPKKNLKALSHERPTDEEENALIKFLMEGPPVAVAILGISLLERELEDLLRRRFRRKDEETMEMLTDQSGPIGTFSQKILLGYAFGFYDERVMENLHIARRIRNAFAHAKKLLEFDHPLITAELDKVKLPSNRRSKLWKSLHGAKDTALAGKSRYFCLCLGLSAVLIRKSGSLIHQSVRSRGYRTKRKWDLINQYLSGLGIASGALFTPSTLGVQRGLSLLNHTPSPKK